MLIIVYNRGSQAVLNCIHFVLNINIKYFISDDYKVHVR